jgi:hypothetical protein
MINLFDLGAGASARVAARDGNAMQLPKLAMIFSASMIIISLTISVGKKNESIFWMIASSVSALAEGVGCPNYAWISPSWQVLRSEEPSRTGRSTLISRQ